MAHKTITISEEAYRDLARMKRRDEAERKCMPPGRICEEILAIINFLVEYTVAYIHSPTATHVLV